MTTSASRVPALDGLRGAAVAMVVLAHAWVGEEWAGRPLGPLAAYLVRSVGGGVDLFFTLSGFLIGGILLREAQSPRLYPVFYARRAFRILPLYGLLLASYAVARALDQRTQFGLIYDLYDPNPWGLWRYALFLQNVVMAQTRNIEPVWLVVTWSLAVEEQFYLVAPWVVRHCTRALPLLCLAGIAASLGLRTYLLLGPSRNIVAANVLLPCRLDALCVGMLVAILAHRPGAAAWLRARRPALAAAPWLAALLYFAVPYLDTHTNTDRTWDPLALAVANGLILLHLGRAPAGALARVLAWAPLAALGGISYFVYLFHMPLRYVALARLGPERYGAAVGLSTAAVLVAGLASRRWLEQPLVRFAHRFSYRPGGRAAA
jgi:peptidoglycan/LPS O-acetylase OafA/YrhL